MRALLPLFLGCLLLSPAAGATGPAARFEALRQGSQPVGEHGGLGPFLSRYVGECEDVETRAECRAGAKAFRQKLSGKRLYMLLTEEVASGLLAPARFDAASGDFTLLLTPIFGAQGMALTQGTPRRTDAEGNPVLQPLRLQGSAPEPWTRSRFERLVSQQELRVEVLFAPEDTWALRSRQGPVRGVKARLLAVAVTHSRSGETLALWTAPGAERR